MAQKPPGTESEHRIMDRDRAVREGDEGRSPSLQVELDRLFAAHREKVYRFCLKLMGDPERAEELVQETLVAAYQKLPSFDRASRFEHWVYGIARNQCRNALRKRGELLTHDGVIEATSPFADALTRAQAGEREALVRAAAEAVLNPHEQEVVALRYVEGLSQSEITELLGLDGSGARGVLQRCRRKLGRELRRRIEAMGHGESFVRGDS